ncbi:hypothetical protein IAR55_006011 [Kwoniella newhampshirensis]|uniref:Uncharacterized protein n=1 Tax=Kwoniella newhampshirensis TaxID=1651941 RepID=A0AAW0YXH7_9TREE
MRVISLLFALGLVGSALSAPAPIPQPQPLMIPALFAKDPLSIHRRSVIPPPAAIDDEVVEDQERIEGASLGGSQVQVDLDAETETLAEAEQPSEDSCAAVCGVQRVEGAKSEREALCSADGLHATLNCAQCIDNTWPDTTYEDSAMAEYQRIVDACNDTPQK